MQAIFLNMEMQLKMFDIVEFVKKVKTPEFLVARGRVGTVIFTKDPDNFIVELDCGTLLTSPDIKMHQLKIRNSHEKDN